MNTQLPNQYNSWYAFWLDVKDVLDGNQKIKVPIGGVYLGEAHETTWLEFSVEQIKINAFNEVEPFLPLNHHELSKLIHAERMFSGAQEKSKWYDFHLLIG